ncbi:MAG: KpsF/GutQ family sugar-phosphate isomerase [Ignavibacteriaceae bacterium]|nr:KpsF/GutQ family sugar-phosphate isomerase [Ignavibacteriaceae bacterium]
MTSEEIIAKGKDVVRIEANAVTGLQESIDKNFVNAVDTILNCKGRVVLTGMGKSGLIARKIVATLNSTGTPAIYMHPTDALHGDLGMVRSDDVVIVLSKSGTTEEIVSLVTLIKRLKAPVIGMVSDLNSKLAKEVDIVLHIPIKEEACPHDLAPTASTTASLVMGDALSVVLLEKRGFTAEDFAMLHPGGSLGKRLSLKVEEIMIKGADIPMVNTSTPLKDAIIEITSKRLGVTSVVNDNGILVGIITDGDLRRLLERTLDIKDLKAADIMTKNPKVIARSILASRALQMMENYKITSLIVADENRVPKGIVHLHDLVNLGLKIR